MGGEGSAWTVAAEIQAWADGWANYKELWSIQRGKSMKLPIGPQVPGGAGAEETSDSKDGVYNYQSWLIMDKGQVNMVFISAAVLGILAAVIGLVMAGLYSAGEPCCGEK